MAVRDDAGTPAQDDDGFASMGWHDNAVHALRIVEGADGEGELLLDIDHIEEWIADGEYFTFLVSPATLRFHQVTELRVLIDYATPSAGMCPFTIERIERELVHYPTGHTSWAWTITLNWPDGEITFCSPAFTQTRSGATQRSQNPSLTPEQRGTPLPG